MKINKINQDTQVRNSNNKSLAYLWAMRYILENMLDIKNPEHIDPFAFSLWLQGLTGISIGQKRNIAAAFNKNFGIKLPAIYGPKREALEVIKPTVETFHRTMQKLGEFKNNAPAELRDIRQLASDAFFCTSITGLSISDLIRSEICHKQEIEPGRSIAGKEKYKFIISVNPSECHKVSHSVHKQQVCLTNFSASSFQMFEFILERLRRIGSTSESAQVISQIQYIIAKHNEAKGYNLRELRKLYPAILGYIKSVS